MTDYPGDGPGEVPAQGSGEESQRPDAASAPGPPPAPGSWPPSPEQYTGQPYGGQPYGGQPYTGQPYTGYPPAGYPPPPGYFPAPPNHPRATLALALGITGLAGGLFFCGVPLLVSPFAWVVGHRALRDIRAAAGRLGGESSAQAGMVMGIVGTVLLFVFVIVVALVVIGLAATHFSPTPPHGKSV